MDALRLRRMSNAPPRAAQANYGVTVAVDPAASNTSNGSIRTLNQFIPQCRCGPVARPVAPTAANI